MVPKVISPSLTICHSTEQNHWLPPSSVQLRFQSFLCKASVKILSIFLLPPCFTVRSPPPTALSPGNSPSFRKHLLQGKPPSPPASPSQGQGPQELVQSRIWESVSSPLMCSGFRPLLYQDSCSSILWCDTTISEKFHHLQQSYCFPSACIQLFVLKAAL